MKIFIVPLLALLLASVVSAQVGQTEYSNYATLTPGAATTFSFEGELGVSSVVIHATDDAAENRGRLFVAEAFVSAFKESYFKNQGKEVERYLLISPKGIAERNVESITIYYTEPLQLYKETNSGWEPLESWRDSSIYYATTSSFGNFALAQGEVTPVGGEHPDPEVEPEVTPPEVEEPEVIPEGSEENESPQVEPDVPEPIDQPLVDDPLPAERGSEAPQNANVLIIGAIVLVGGAAAYAAYRLLSKSTTAKARKK